MSEIRLLWCKCVILVLKEKLQLIFRFLVLFIFFDIVHHTSHRHLPPHIHYQPLTTTAHHHPLAITHHLLFTVHQDEGTLRGYTLFHVHRSGCFLHYAITLSSLTRFLFMLFPVVTCCSLPFISIFSTFLLSLLLDVPYICFLFLFLLFRPCYFIRRLALNYVSSLLCFVLVYFFSFSVVHSPSLFSHLHPCLTVLLLHIYHFYYPLLFPM